MIGLQNAEVNWSQVDAEPRKRAVRVLKMYLEAEYPELLGDWREQHAAGRDFLISIEMADKIKGILRLEISENNLPWVEKSTVRKGKDWNDFYLAALREALGLDAA